MVRQDDGDVERPTKRSVLVQQPQSTTLFPTFVSISIRKSALYFCHIVVTQKGIPLNYVIDQAAVGRKHAGSKARDDVNSILEKRGFVRKTIECTYSADIRSILKDTFSVPRQAKQIVRSFEKDSFFVLQFPFRCFTAHLGAELCRIAHRRNGYAVALIHDLDALRCSENQRGFIEKTLRNEIAFLENFDCIIAHNRKMKQYLTAHGIESNKIIEL